MMLYGLLVSISYICIYKRHIVTLKLSGLITSLLHVKMSSKVCTLGYIVMYVNQLTNIGTTLSVSLAEVMCITICDGSLCIDLCHSATKVFWYQFLFWVLLPSSSSSLFCRGLCWRWKNLLRGTGNHLKNDSLVKFYNVLSHYNGFHSLLSCTEQITPVFDKCKF